MSGRKVFKYSGRDVDVFWDGRLCIHIGECGHSEGDLFVGGRDPWCVPDNATTDDVGEVCQRCPTGALVYQGDAAGDETPDSENSVTVSHHGPLFVRGDLGIVGAPDDMPGVRFRAALCRCGQSANKPFCDNSHEQAGFRDYGAVGKRGPGFEGHGGKFGIRLRKDGPLVLTGKVNIRNGSGRVAWRGEEVALCRCGVSKNKPFCDGTHKRVGFKAE
ncbi:MAG: hypothetical protein DRR03_01520 [Gammaproteobacteria bacterium]|nr:MAG: hypothetical protein DRR03_01520 [Gammaproteobacteria bacterium]